MSTNCYLVWADGRQDAYIVDPGGSADMIAESLAERKLKPAAVLLTHSHPDHFLAAPELMKRFRIPIWMHERDRETYRKIAKALSDTLPEPVKELPKIEGVKVVPLDAPGHTPGGVSFYLPDASAVLVGDTLFQGSVGRTDLPGGDMETLIKSIRTKLLTLPPETKVHAGHLGQSTIGAEAATNPFLQDRPKR
jgi:glyoxylase-like metal-dependent hydrolase (beta-lactamase superfamily II)